MGLRVGLDGCEKSRPHRDSIPGPSGFVATRYTDRVIPAYPPRYFVYTRVGTLIVATIYLQLIQNRYLFRSFTVLQCSHQHCVQPVSSDVEVVGYL